MDNDKLILRAIKYAKDNLDNHELAVQNIADAAGFSLDYFNRMFFKHTGFTVMAYVSYIRLKKAAVLLRNPDISITDVAMDTGYDSLEGFSKAFGKRYGVVPSEYRRRMKNRTVAYGDLADKAVTHRFIHDHPEFEVVDTDQVIDYLMDIDAMRFGWVCGEIICTGLMLAAPEGKYEHGFIGIQDDLKGGYSITLFSDNTRFISEWLNKFGENKAVQYMNGNHEAEEWLRSNSFDYEIHELAVYTGEEQDVSLPETIRIRKLRVGDRKSVLKWAVGKDDAYIKHLLTESHYLDDGVLEYGVFDGNELIAVAGCGLDDVNGVKMNDCCIIRFADGKENDELYKAIYVNVTNDMWRSGIVPYESMQFGDYAKQHGGFYATDIGFEIVNRKYKICY